MRSRVRRSRAYDRGLEKDERGTHINSKSERHLAQIVSSMLPAILSVDQNFLAHRLPLNSEM